MDATRFAISEYGLSNTTLARVAEAAGLSTGIVNFYFHSKRQLLLETLGALSREYMEAIELARKLAAEFSDDPADALADVIRAHFAPEICNPEKISVWYAFSGESRAREEYLDDLPRTRPTLPGNPAGTGHAPVPTGRRQKTQRPRHRPRAGRAAGRLLAGLPV